MHAIPKESDPWKPSRRHLLQALAAVGVGTTTFQRALVAQAEAAPAVTPEMIQQAEWIAGITLSEDDRKAAARAMNQTMNDYKAIRAVPIDNGVPPALVFNPMPWHVEHFNGQRGTVEPMESVAGKRPDNEDTLAFLSIAELGGLIRTRQLTSTELTKLYLERLKKFDPILHCVVTLTEDLALKQAEQADREIAAGHYRGPLHGIPWGAKDLIAYPGYKTTWGATPYKDQTLDVKATVARRLDDAGAVLVAKLSLGALAMGDQWFGGQTRNPWDPARGSSGSSAGSASATAGGLVGFGVGTETLGSIVSPSRVCGTSGLRPTFGRISRQGCMALTWSMDKLGPLCRSLEDCALVFGAVHGADGMDPAAVDRPFSWPVRRDLRTYKVGYFSSNRPIEERPELAVLKDMGVQLVQVKLPDKLPVMALRMILNVEAATAFDEITRKGVTEGLNSWPRTFQQGQFVTAVEYLRANRIRTLLMKEMDELMNQVDLYVGGNDLFITNLTGHPTIVMPSGFTQRNGMEALSTITMTGRLYGEDDLLHVGYAYQKATGHHLKHPNMAKWLEKKEQ